MTITNKGHEGDPPVVDAVMWMVFALLFVGIAVCLALVGATWWMVDTTSLSSWGQFGDTTAAGGLLLTGLGLFVTALAVLLQRKEIRLQIKEMKTSSAAQDRLAAAQERDLAARYLEAGIASVREYRQNFQASLAAATQARDEEVAMNHARTSGPMRGADLFVAKLMRNTVQQKNWMRLQRVVSEWYPKLNVVEWVLLEALIKLRQAKPEEVEGIVRGKEVEFTMGTLKDAAGEVVNAMKTMTYYIPDNLEIEPDDHVEVEVRNEDIDTPAV